MDETPPWSYITAKAAAKKLGVSTELINGLAADRRSDLRAVKTEGATGQPVWLVSKSDVAKLARLLEERRSQ